MARGNADLESVRNATRDDSDCSPSREDGSTNGDSDCETYPVTTRRHVPRDDEECNNATANSAVFICYFCFENLLFAL